MGTPKSSKTLGYGLVLRPLVTFGSPIKKNTHFKKPPFIYIYIYEYIIIEYYQNRKSVPMF